MICFGGNTRRFYTINKNVIGQIPLLLSIGEEDTALMKATECGDTDLVYLVLFHIWRKVCRLQCKLYIQIKGLIS